MNPYVSRRTRQGSFGSGRKSERKTAKRLGGRQTPASGAVGVKGDINLGQFMIEAKSTKDKSMRLELEWLVKVLREAMPVGKHPALALTFTDPMGEPVPCGRWVMVPESLFLEVLT